MGWSFDIASASTHKYAVRECGDVVQLIDLPDQGVALVLADGQGSGSGARALARMAAEIATQILYKGGRAEAAISAVSDALFENRGGKVSVSIDAVRCDRRGAIDIARLSTNQLFINESGGWKGLGATHEPAGRYERQQPEHWLLSADTIHALLLVTDGISGAGNKFDNHFNLKSHLDLMIGEFDASSAATLVLNQAMQHDRGRPTDDMTVVFAAIASRDEDQRRETQRLARVIR